MGAHQEDKKPGMPWQWKLSLVRVFLALGLGAGAFVYFAYLLIIGETGKAFGVAFCIVVGVRLLGGALLDIDRK